MSSYGYSNKGNGAGNNGTYYPRQTYGSSNKRNGAGNANDTYSPRQFSGHKNQASNKQRGPNQLAVLEVQIGLEQLSEAPQEYDMWADAIVLSMSAGMGKDEMFAIGRLIVKMSYQNGGYNVQYSFARLCHLLDQTFENFVTQFVVPHMAILVNNYDLKSLSAKQLGKFTLFTAELYARITTNEVRLTSLGRYVVKQIREQLNNKSLNDKAADNCIQVLRLTGYYIGEDLGSDELDKLFKQLNALHESSTLSPTTKNSICQLNGLRESGWGIGEEELAVDSNDFVDQGNGEIFYGPDGTPFTEEEIMFLQESCREVATLLKESFEDEDEIIPHEKADDIEAATQALERLNVSNNHVTK